MVRFKTLGGIQPNTQIHHNMDDTALYTAKIHWISFVKPSVFIMIGMPFVVCIMAQDLFGTLLFGVGAYLAGYKGMLQILDLKNTRIYVGEKLLTIRTGLLTKNMQDVSLSKYKGMRFNKSLLGRIFNFGKFTINTGEISTSFTISDPENLRKAIIDQTNKFNY